MSLRSAIEKTRAGVESKQDRELLVEAAEQLLAIEAELGGPANAEGTKKLLQDLLKELKEISEELAEERREG